MKIAYYLTEHATMKTIVADLVFLMFSYWKKYRPAGSLRVNTQIVAFMALIRLAMLKSCENTTELDDTPKQDTMVFTKVYSLEVLVTEAIFSMVELSPKNGDYIYLNRYFKRVTRLIR